MKEELLPTHMDPTGFHTLEVIAKADQFNKWMYQTIRPYLKGNILEIGSGIGNISEFVINDGFDITLSDYNPEYFHTLSNLYSGRSNVKEILSIDLQHPHFFSIYSHLKEKYDTIYLLNVIEHLEDDATAIRFCHSLLKPGGRLIVLAPAYQFLYSTLDKELGHYRRYTIKKLAQLLEHQQLSVLQNHYFNALGMAGWLVSGKFLGNRRLEAGETSLFNKLVPFAKLADWLTAGKTGLSVIMTAEKK